MAPAKGRQTRITLATPVRNDNWDDVRNALRAITSRIDGLFGADQNMIHAGQSFVRVQLPDGSITLAQLNPSLQALINGKLDTSLFTQQHTTGGNHLDNTINPPGGIVAFAGNTPPSGWLECDGSAVSRTTYADLFSAIGVLWGPGDGSTTFNLPNLSGRMLAGFSSGSSDFDPVGKTDGDATKTLTVSNLPSHNHGITDPGHSHGITDPGHSHGITDPSHSHGITDPGHDHNIPSDSAANAGASNASSSTSAATISTSSATTGVTVDSAATGVTVNSAATGVSAQTNFTGISVTNITGGGTAFDVLNPYGVVKWIIKT